MAWDLYLIDLYLGNYDGMKKICILQNSISYGGTDTFVINLCNGLIQDGYDVTVVLSLSQEFAGSRLKELQDTGVKIEWTCELKNLKGKLKHFSMLYKELKKNNYDVFQTNIDLFNGPNLFIAWLAKVPIRICHSHNSQQGMELRMGKKISVVLYQSIMRWLCWNFSNRRCGCSKMALNFLYGNKYLKDPFTFIIPNGIDLDLYQKEIDIKSKKKILNLNNKFNVCTVGRISYQKNPEFLLDVFKVLSEIRDDVDLIWCGTGELENDLKQKVIEYNLVHRVHLLGERNDIPEILKCSNIFLLPSRFEGLGIVLVEAQASNLLCVISDAVPEEVDCGLCVVVSLNDSPIIWARKISELLDEQEFFKPQTEKLKKYSIEYMVDMMKEVIEL